VSIPELRALLSELTAGAAPTMERASAPAPGLMDALAAAPAARRAAVLQAHVDASARKVLGLRGSRTLDRHRPLHEMGLDSLMAVELRNALAADLGRPLPAAVLFDYPSVQSLTDYVATKVLNLAPAERTVPCKDAARPESGLSDLQHLSEDEAESLLLAELERSKTADR
jgi:acyl carrier protein